MFSILVDFNLTKKIKINKLGIVFRRLTTSEKNMILQQINNIYFKNKKLINYAIKNYESKDEMKLSLDLLKYDDVTRKIVMFCFLGFKSGFTFNTPKRIEKILDQLIIIDYDKTVLLEFIEEKNVTKLISNLLSLYDIYSADIKFNEKVRFDYSFILNDNILNPDEKDYDINLIMNIIAKYQQNKLMKKMVEISEEYLLKLQKFISKLNKDEIRRFLNAIDLLYTEHKMIQNSIISKVTIIEGILINEEEEIKSNYILKAGLIFKHYAKSRSETNNKFIKDFLNYSYEIRSAIIHGNEEKILVIFNKVMQKNKYIKQLVHGNIESYNSKKMQAFLLANMILSLTVRAVIKCWIDHPSIISFMKNK